MTDDPISAAMRRFDPAPEHLLRLRRLLLRLHKTLLDDERANFERVHGRIESSYQLLNLVMSDPWFDWLHALSELVVQIDEALDAEEPLSAERARQFVGQTQELLTPAEAGTGFGRKYYEALQRSPDVVLAHREVTKVLEATQ
jgi:hypothetical protein